jgi:UDP-N-acetylmuramoylalanine--D-glutamate ligase
LGVKTGKAGMEIKNKKVTVVGLGKSGLAASLFLKDKGAKVWVTDFGISPQIQSRAKILEAEGISVEIGKHNPRPVTRTDLIVVSPGVDNNSPVMRLAKGLNIPVISEIELGFMSCPAQIIAITGTNGKSTTATLIHKILTYAGRRAHLLGNIGEPLCAHLDDIDSGDIISLEVSSFQLENTVKFRPKVAVMLNLTPDHLDRHADIQNYLNAKKKIFANQNSNDWTLFNYDDPVLRRLSGQTRAKVLFFRDNCQDGLNSNTQAAIAACSVFGIDEKTAQEAISDFRGLPHRLEYVGNIRGVEFVNDSKATNVDSTVWALRNINKPIILIAGGRDKGCPFEQIKGLIRTKVRCLIVIGEAREKIKFALNGAGPEIEDALSLEEAVFLAGQRALPGDCVLLSPMCASFDMFKNFEERGEVFKRAVREFARTKTERLQRDPILVGEKF